MYKTFTVSFVRKVRTTGTVTAYDEDDAIDRIAERIDKEDYSSLDEKELDREVDEVTVESIEDSLSKFKEQREME